MKNIIYSIIILLVFTSFQIIYAKKNIAPKELNETVITSNKVGEKMKLYFPEIDDLKLVKIERKVDNIDYNNVVESIINELIKGPEEDNLLSIIPDKTKLNKGYIQNRIAYVDFSKEFITNHPGGSWGEYSTIYGIVNSLCELNNVDAVQFLIDGKIENEYKGHINIDKPLECLTDS